MSISHRRERSRHSAWFLGSCAVSVLLAPLFDFAVGDELVMRPGMRLKDKQVYSFDEDGVRLGPASRPIGWEAIEGGTLSKDQARFDRFRQELSGPMQKIHTKLAAGDFSTLLEPAQALFPRFAERRSNSAYVVAQSLLWAKLARHTSEEAIEPFLVCAYLRHTVKDLGSPPGRRRLQIDSQTGLCPELPLVGFDRTRAAAALGHVRARLRKLGPAPSPAIPLYVAALALAAGDAAAADAELAALGSPSRSVAEISDALRAQAMAVRGQKAEALLRFERLREGCLPSIRGLVSYLMGTARLEVGKGNPADAVLDLLDAAASNGSGQPALSAAALDAAQDVLRTQKELAAARAVQIELLRSFPETDHAARVRAELGPDSEVIKAIAEMEAAASKASLDGTGEGDARRPPRSSGGDRPSPRKRSSPAKAEESSR